MLWAFYDLAMTFLDLEPPTGGVSAGPREATKRASEVASAS